MFFWKEKKNTKTFRVFRGYVSSHFACFYIPDCLEVVTKSVQLGKHEVYVTFLTCLVGNDAAEEVGVFTQRLVADHDSALSHHAGLDLCSYLKKNGNLNSLQKKHSFFGCFLNPDLVNHEIGVVRESMVSNLIIFLYLKYLSELPLPVTGIGLRKVPGSESLWHIPEAHVGAFGLLIQQVELLWLLFHLLDLDKNL